MHEMTVTIDPPCQFRFTLHNDLDALESGELKVREAKV